MTTNKTLLSGFRLHDLMAVAARLRERFRHPDHPAAAIETPPFQRKRLPRLLFETLEPRLLLSASPITPPAIAASIDVDFSANLGSVNAILQVVNSINGPVLQLTNNGAFVDSELLDKDVKVNFKGSAFSDTVTIDIRFDDGAAGTNPFTGRTIFLDFDGGFDTPLVNDQVIVASTGPDLYTPSSFFIKSTDEVLVNSAITTLQDLQIESTESITLNAAGSIAAGGDIYLAVNSVAKAGILGTDLLANAGGQITVSGATLTGEDIGLVVNSKIAIDSKAIDLFGGVVKVVAIQGTSTAGILVNAASVITATADLLLSATSDVTAKATTAPDSSSNSSSADATIATTIISSSATTTVAGSANLTAGGVADVKAQNTVNIITSADGTGGGSSGSAVGGTLALTILSGDTQAAIDGAARLRGATVNVVAKSDRTVETFAKATQGGATDDGTANNTRSEQKLTEFDAKADTGGGGGSVSFAAAVAITSITGDAIASIASTGLVRGDNGISVRAEANHPNPLTAGRFTTVADGSATSGNVGVGVAVAINIGNSDARAFIANAAQLQGSTIAVDSVLTTADRFGAQATSGASGSSVGIAGSLAVNSGIMRSEATLESGANTTIVGSGGFLLRANSTTGNTAKALPRAGVSGESLGVGASVAINIADTVTRAEIENTASLAGAGAVTVSANSNSAINSEARAGAKGGTAVVPVAAITIANEDTLARIGTGTTLSAASANVTATHRGTSTSKAEGDAQGTTNAAIGVSFGLGVTVDKTEATIDRALVLGGALVLRADSRQVTTTNARASSKGGEEADANGNTSGDNVDQKTTKTRGLGDSVATSKGGRNSSAGGASPSASVADKNGDSSGQTSVSVAAAVAVNIADSTARAAIANGRSVTAGGAVDIHSSANTDATADADGKATGGSSAGVGAAVAINVGNVTNEAFVGTAATVAATGLSVRADMTTFGADSRHVFSATTASGAGSEGVGVAGSVSVNVGSVNTRAELRGNSIATLSGGSANLIAASDSSNDAHALPKENATGKNVGIGASVAVNVADNTTNAELFNTAALTGAGAVTGPKSRKKRISVTMCHINNLRIVCKNI